MPEAVNSVVVGDPALFQVEHTRQPELVFVKALTNEHAESNLLISTARGRQISFLRLAVAKARTRRRSISCCDTSHPAASRSSPTPFLSRSLHRPLACRRRRQQSFRQLRVPWEPELRRYPRHSRRPISGGNSADPTQTGLSRQPAGTPATSSHAVLDGERPEGDEVKGNRLRAGISEVLDAGQQVIVLFRREHQQTRHPVDAAANPAGRPDKSGKLIKHEHWSTAEQWR